jgi:hypothetical protein
MGKIIPAAHRFKAPHQITDIDWLNLAKAAHLMNTRITLALAVLKQAQKDNANEKPSQPS